MPEKNILSVRIKEHAATLGFDACGICRAEEVDILTQNHLREWIEKGYHADMEYISGNIDKKNNPQLLVEGAKSIICVALNYYPSQKQLLSAPQIAYYAYGKDYHEVLKIKLQSLFDYIKTLIPNAEGRAFVDTAPVLERYWAAKAGIGFIGKNSLLIIPKKGSYYFLGEIIVNAELEYDNPLEISCGSCTRCVEACPTSAIEKPYLINSNLCISYQTIENKGEINTSIISKLSNNLYGCDICQQVCPWNKFATPNTSKEFEPDEEFLQLDYQKLEKMTIEDYRRIFKGSAIKRAKYSGLMRNLKALKPNQI